MDRVRVGCEQCGGTAGMDYRNETPDAARVRLVRALAGEGWIFSDSAALCPECAAPADPFGGAGGA